MDVICQVALSSSFLRIFEPQRKNIKFVQWIFYISIMCSYCSISPVWCKFSFKDHNPNIKFFLDQEDAGPVESSNNKFHLWRVALCSRSPCATITLGGLSWGLKAELFTLPRKSLLFELIKSFTVHMPRKSLSFELIVILFFTICSIIPYLVTGHVIELGKKVSHKMHTESCNEQLLSVTKSKELGCYGCIHMYTILSTLLWLNLGRTVSCWFKLWCLKPRWNRQNKSPSAFSLTEADIVKHVLSLMGSICECNLWGRLILIL